MKRRPRKKVTSLPPTITWKHGAVVLVDQTLLPTKLKFLRITRVEAMREAIRSLRVRGAPAIGVAAAYGVVLGAMKSRAGNARAFRRDVFRAADRLATSRPTAVNLFWALDKMRGVCDRLVQVFEARPWDLNFAVIMLFLEASAIREEDVRMCQAIGQHGAVLLQRGATVLTHCNAGALATSGSGTALSVIYAAQKQGKKIRVFADETRPLLQGARLTCWELVRSGVDVTLICDNMAASVLRSGKVDCVIVGADRIARNGDVANKIGTYGLALLARAHHVPFYVAAPFTTFDLKLASGAAIPIEERAAEEISKSFGCRTAPDGIAVHNPAFDVTPARLVTAIITEHGVVRPPYLGNIRRLLKA